MKIQYSKSTLVIVHLLIGFVLSFRVLTPLYPVLILLIGTVVMYRSKNNHNEAAFMSAYVVGSEVLIRMSRGTVLYELPKYTILLFLLMGLFLESKRHHISVSYLIYILLLLLGISFMDIPFGESIRRAVAFNLSGPVLLGVAAIYFYNRKMKLEEVIDLLFVMVLPIISMVSYLYFYSPNLKDIVFNSAANATLSGGFGPNQVATILGLGIFIFFVHLMLKKRITSLFIFDVILFMYLIYRGLLTFSRGGILTAFLAILAFSFYYFLTTKNKMNELLKYSAFIAVIGIALWTYTVSQTGGMLENRYTNRSTTGEVKNDFTTGRGKIFMAELQGFMENPFFGLGVGGSKFYRADTIDINLASHNEVGRLLSEHGMIGVVILVLLISLALGHILKQPLFIRGLLSGFLILWFLTISHSAMRVAFPSFIYGMSLISINFHSKSNAKKNIGIEKNSVHRE